MYTNLRLAHNIGTEKHSNYHTREQILACQDPIGFDGVYKNVYDNKDVLKGKSGIMFVMGNYIGRDNKFDIQNVPKEERYCTLEEVKEMCDEFDFEIGWHTWSHRLLHTLSDKEIKQEVTAPFETKYFRYPFGDYGDDRVIEIVKSAGYEAAWCVTQGVRNMDMPNAKYKIYSNYVDFTEIPTY